MKNPRAAAEPVIEALAQAPAAPAVVEVLRVDREGDVWVDVPGRGETRARALASVSRHDLQGGRQALVLFESGDPARPILVGLIEDPTERIFALTADDARPAEGDDAPRERVFRAEESITLVCGRASLTLHADGRVVTRGVNVVSVASEQQRIQGAVVRIN